MADRKESLDRLISRFITELMAKWPQAELGGLRDEISDLEARLVRVEAALEKADVELAPAKPSRRIKRVTLKDRVVRLVESRPDGARTSEISRILGVAQANVSHALRQATDENLIIKEKRGLYRPK